MLIPQFQNGIKMNLNQLENDELINLLYRLDPQRLIMSKMVCKGWNKILDLNICDVWSKAMQYYHAYIPIYMSQLEDLKLRGQHIQVLYVQRFKNCRNIAMNKCQRITHSLNMSKPHPVFIYNNHCIGRKKVNFGRKKKDYSPKLFRFDIKTEKYEKAKGLPHRASPLFSNLNEDFASVVKFGKNISINFLPFKNGLRRYCTDGSRLRRIQILQDNYDSIWSLNPFQCLFWTLKTHPVMWANDVESKVVFRTPKGSIKIWDFSKKIITHKLNPSREPNVALKSVTLDKHVLYITYDNLFIAHDLRADKEVYRISNPDILATHLSPNRVILANVNNIYLYGRKMGEPLGSIEDVKIGDFSFLGKRSITILSGQKFATYDVEDFFSLKSEITINATLLKTSIVKNRLIVCATNDKGINHLQIWNTDNGQELLTAQPRQDLANAEFHISQNILCLATKANWVYANEVTFWDLSKGKCLRVEFLQKQNIYYISFKNGVLTSAYFEQCSDEVYFNFEKLSFS